MKETREKEIKNKVFSKKDICAIWKKINDEYKSSKQSGNHTSFKLTINCEDGTRYESEDSDLLNDGGIIDLKKSESISFDYCDYELERRISITLRHGDYGSELVVTGKDRGWVAGVFDELDTVLNSLKPQESWLMRYKVLTLHLVALGVGFAIYSMFDLLWYRHITPLENPSKNILVIREFLQQNYLFNTLIDVFLFWLQGIFPALWLQEWILKLWPSVEFDFGPEHQKIEKMRRNRIGIILSIIILPFLINFIYNIVVKFWN